MSGRTYLSAILYVRLSVSISYERNAQILKTSHMNLLWNQIYWIRNLSKCFEYFFNTMKRDKSRKTFSRVRFTIRGNTQGRRL